MIIKQKDCPEKNAYNVKFKALATGDSYVVKGNDFHAMEMLEDSEWVDMFSPPREEYRN